MVCDLYSVVITQETATRYFGTEDPIGKVLTVENIYDVKVTGIIQNIPENSTLQFDFLSPFPLLKEFIGENNMQNWNFNSFMTFVQLTEHTNVLGMSQTVAGYLDKLVPEEDYKLVLQPFKKIHLSSYVLHDFSGVGDMKYVYIFSVLALFVLIIACINFMNLATARSSRRALEVGIRKVSGAKRTDLIKQFFGEAIFLSFISLILAIFLVEILLPSFNRLSGKNLGLDFSGNISIYLGLLAITIVSGIFSGMYPALFLSSFQPVKVLKGTLRTGSRGGLFRKVLVVTQFSLSIFLIIATMVIFRQLNYIRSIDMGYDRDHIPVGKRFAFWEQWGTIVGVAKNFHFQSIHNKINPISFKLNPGWLRYIYIRIKPDDIPATIGFMKKTWNGIVPDYPFEYHFLDESFEELYKSEQQMSAITNYFTILGIFIACLGLFGLAAFMAERRTKEIGIRKVLGASVPKLIYLLSSEFAKWVLVANIIAWPVAYLVAHRWLQNFAYRTNIHAGIFFLAAALSLFIALATVSFKALKTATANPAKALRYE